ncbi:uncharacterized protein N7477_000247 [Penicillium maclennaniae]|uniref:uncharacterized protein n=1 Tax=Penicillium maclennaniae TaxID=1343394 RepID=UPI0025406AB3|nr:uncharacterized protein N7477_000247 [Penicillium maclennaniae]KAJ5683902.1 hypothetical protein N7477_000247 [Penicillium maclennaniae]
MTIKNDAKFSFNETIDTKPYFKKQNLAEMGSIISFKHFRNLLFNRGNPANIKFWLLSESVHHVERVQKYKRLYLLHDQNDRETTIMARSKSDASLTSSDDPGALCIFIERLRNWGHVWNSSGYLDWIAKTHPSFANNTLVFVQDLLLHSPMDING